MPTLLQRFRRVLLVVVALLGAASAVRAQAPVSSPPRDTVSTPHTGDEPDVLRETQLGIREKDHTGLVWWVPYEFWEQAAQKRGVSSPQAGETFKALKDYVVLGIFVAKISALGSFEFVSGPEIAKHTLVRDANNVDYAAVQDPAQDAKNLAAMMKPLLASALGKAGENFELLFFPAHTKTGAVIADAQQKGRFSVVLKDIAGVPESVYEWRLPLTSVTTPKYCPKGQERVNANWEFCPWHGAPLNTASK